MIDYLYLSAYSSSLADSLLAHQGLDFSTPVNDKTGEIILTKSGLILRKAKANEMEFIVYNNGRVEIKGSLHKFFNSIYGINGNWDLFTYSDAVEAVKMLNEMYSIPTDISIHNIELGANMELSGLQVNDVLDYFIAFKNKQFNRMKIQDGKGKGLDVYFSQYGIKVYNKGIHYHVNKQIIRFEIKYIKMQSFEGGLCLADLTNLDVWTNLSERLKGALQEVIFTDDFTSSQLTSKEKELYTFCSNPKNWENIEKRKRYKVKDSFQTLINIKGLYHFGDFFTDFLNDVIQKMKAEKRDFFTGVENTEKGLFYPLSISNNSPSPTSSTSQSLEADPYGRTCIITGLPMTLERSKRKTENCIGVSTVRWLKKHDLTTYLILCATYLTNTRTGYCSREPDEVGKLAKQIRNKLSNAKIYRDRVHHRRIENQLNIF